MKTSVHQVIWPVDDTCFRVEARSTHLRLWKSRRLYQSGRLTFRLESLAWHIQLRAVYALSSHRQAEVGLFLPITAGLSQCATQVQLGCRAPCARKLMPFATPFQ
ncbi:unnamed protein product [Calypogeia fissa]